MSLSSPLLAVNISLVNDLTLELKRGNKSFLVTPEGTVRNLTYSESIAESFGCSLERDYRIKNIARVIIAHLATQPRNGFPKEMLGNPWIKVAKLFRKQLAPLCAKNDPMMKKVHEEEFLTRLGLSSDHLNHPEVRDFFNWATNPGCRADSAIAYFEHKIRILHSGSLEIDTLGETVVWNRVKDEAFNNLQRAKKDFIEPWRISLYGKNGPTFRDVYQVTGYATKTVIPAPSRNLFSILVHAPVPGVVDNHSWVNIVKRSSSELFSYTIYRPYGTAQPKTQIGNIAEGTLDDHWPDYSIDGRIDVAITDEEVNKVLDFVKWLSRQTVPFHNYNINCTDFALSLLKHLDITPPKGDVSFWRVVAPRHIVSLSLAIDGCLPTPLQRTAEFVVAVFGNIISLAYGASQIDDNLKGKVNPLNPSKTIEAHLESYKDIFNEDKLRFTSPYYFIDSTIKVLTKWRAAEKERLERYSGITQKQIDAIDYDVLPSWRGRPLDTVANPSFLAASL